MVEDKEAIEKKYNNLRNSKLGRVTIWLWGRKKKDKKCKK